MQVTIPQGRAVLPARNTLAGYTEWDGVWDRELIYLYWHWGVLLGALVVINPHRLRTNIQLVEHGREESVPLSRTYLLEWLASFAWPDTVWQVIAQPAPGTA